MSMLRHQTYFIQEQEIHILDIVVASIWEASLQIVGPKICRKLL